MQPLSVSPINRSSAITSYEHVLRNTLLNITGDFLGPLIVEMIRGKGWWRVNEACTLSTHPISHHGLLLPAGRRAMQFSTNVLSASSIALTNLPAYLFAAGSFKVPNLTLSLANQGGIRLGCETFKY